MGHRLIRDESIIFPRSRCPHCLHTIKAYDLIPVLSWLILRGRCRSCHAPISVLYPFIELLTASSMTALAFCQPAHYFLAYFIFFSALIVTIRTDLETMLISRFMTIFLVPLGFVFSLLGLLPISFFDALLGAILGYGFLLFMAWVFKLATGKEGMGQGDLELLAFIGAFTGIIGCWITLLLASCVGSIIGIIYLMLTNAGRSARIPFGPFLACGAMLYVLFQESITSLLLTQTVVV